MLSELVRGTTSRPSPVNHLCFLSGLLITLYLSSSQIRGNGQIRGANTGNGRSPDHTVLVCMNQMNLLPSFLSMGQGYSRVVTTEF